MDEVLSRIACVQRTERDGCVILHASGDFELGCIDVLRTALGGALADHNHVVLDLSETTFANSTALSALVAAWKQATEDGGWMRLVNPRQNVRKLLHVTAIDALIELHDSVDGAMGAAVDPQGGRDTASLSA